MAINPHRKGGPDIPLEDGGTAASDAATALANIGGGTVKAAKRAATSGGALALDTPSSLRGEIAFVEGPNTTVTVYEDAGNDRLVVEIAAAVTAPVIVGMKVARTVGVLVGNSVMNFTSAPNITQGREGVFLNYTPISTSNRIKMRCTGYAFTAGSGRIFGAVLYHNHSGNTVPSGGTGKIDENNHFDSYVVEADFVVPAQGVSIRFSMRFGPPVGQAVNACSLGAGISGNQMFGSAGAAAILTVQEYTPSP